MKTAGGTPLDGIASVADGLPQAVLDDIAEGVVNLNVANGVLHLESASYWVFIPIKYDGSSMTPGGRSSFVEKDPSRPLRYILFREDEKSYCIFEACQNGRQLLLRCKRYRLSLGKVDEVFDVSPAELKLDADVTVENICCAYNNQLRRFLLAFVEEGSDWRLHEVQFKLEAVLETIESTIYERGAS